MTITFLAPAVPSWVLNPTSQRRNKPSMAKEISCQRAGIDCEFLIRSADVSEMLGFVRAHCSDQHGVDVSEGDLREQMVDV